MTAQMTSKMLPMMTCNREPSLKVAVDLRTPTHFQGLNQVHPSGHIVVSMGKSPQVRVRLIGSL